MWQRLWGVNSKMSYIEFVERRFKKADGEPLDLTQQAEA
jgi:hypothetical protein